MKFGRSFRRALTGAVVAATAVACFETASILAASHAAAGRPPVAATVVAPGSGAVLHASLALVQREARAGNLQQEQQATSRASAAAGRLSATAPCDKVIDVDLTAQHLVATACGQAFISTPITSGRPGLRTPTGAFSIFLREQGVYFNSPWPAGDPNYYPPMFVAYAMEFLDGGYFLHTDPDEPIGSFGPGSQNGPYASHGCVHVPTPVMVRLYAWAGNGTRVVIHY
jgi:lipoprotein-anchoring transpeptidase ErfK/SrfK